MSTELENKLYANNVNKENYYSLLEKFNPDSFVVFIGAGINSVIKGVPGWKDLYIDLCKKYGVREENDDDYPKLFSNLFSNIDRNEKATFDNNVFSMIKSKDTSGSLTYMPIVRAFNCFITTNYFDSTEAAFKEKQIIAKEEPKEIKKYLFRFPAILGQPTKNTLTYLHGSEESGFCILREKDYEYFYPSLHDNSTGVYILENSWEVLLTKFNIVFIGCSFEKYIENFIAFLQAKLKEEKLTNPNKSQDIKEHYWITNNSTIQSKGVNDSNDRRNENENNFFKHFEKINIKPIVYTDDHIFVEELCNELAKLGDSQKIREGKDPSII